MVIIIITVIIIIIFCRGLPVRQQQPLVAPRRGERSGASQAKRQQQQHSVHHKLRPLWRQQQAPPRCARLPGERQLQGGRWRSHPEGENQRDGGRQQTENQRFARKTVTSPSFCFWPSDQGLGLWSCTQSYLFLSFFSGPSQYNNNNNKVDLYGN